MKRTSVFLPEPLIERIKAQSRATGLSVSELIRRAADEYLKKQPGDRP